MPVCCVWISSMRSINNVINRSRKVCISVCLQIFYNYVFYVKCVKNWEPLCEVCEICKILFIFFFVFIYIVLFVDGYSPVPAWLVEKNIFEDCRQLWSEWYEISPLLEKIILTTQPLCRDPPHFGSFSSSRIKIISENFENL